MRLLYDYFGEPEYTLVPVTEEEKSFMERIFSYPVGTTINYVAADGNSEVGLILHFNIAGSSVSRSEKLGHNGTRHWYEYVGGVNFSFSAEDNYTAERMHKLHVYCVFTGPVQYVERGRIEGLPTITLRMSSQPRPKIKVGLEALKS